MGTNASAAAERETEKKIGGLPMSRATSGPGRRDRQKREMTRVLIQFL